MKTIENGGTVSMMHATRRSLNNEVKVLARTSTVLALSALLLAGCASEPREPEPEVIPAGFAEFEASCARESGTGAYLVEEDIPIWGKEALQKHYQSKIGQSLAAVEEDPDLEVATAAQPLAIHRVNGVDARWSAAQQTNLTYCVSTGFGTNQTAVINAMATAASAWSSVANVRFVYSSAQNSNCTASNNNVVFDVRPTSGQPYLARAFFPNDPRSQRNILIDSSAFTSTTYTLAAILRHELGHTLGFRHEHTVGATTCYEDENWRALTGYDSASVMHYPQCGGTGGTALTLTTTDRNGVACLYGAASGFTPNCSYRGVRYQAHVQGIGWMPEVFSGNISGTVGQSRRIEAEAMRMVGTPGVGICYQSHVQNVGWQAEVCNGSVSGTTGQSLRLEAIRVRLVGAPAGCNVVYQAHVAGVGWQSPVSNNAIAGTTGQGRAIEGLKVWTTGTCGF